jgi:hypothetical protein
MKVDEQEWATSKAMQGRASVGGKAAAGQVWEKAKQGQARQSKARQSKAKQGKANSKARRRIESILIAF